MDGDGMFQMCTTSSWLRLVHVHTRVCLSVCIAAVFEGAGTLGALVALFASGNWPLGLLLLPWVGLMAFR